MSSPTPSAPPRGHRLLRGALSVCIAVGLVIALMLWGGVSLVDVWQTVRAMPLLAFVAALCVHAGIYALRSRRFQVLIPGSPPPSFTQAFVIGAAHNMAVYLMPAKTGEASWVLYLRARLGIGSAIGLASLLVARLLDLAVLCAELGLVCLSLAVFGWSDKLPWLWAAGGALLALTLIFFVLSARSQWLVIVAHRLLALSGLAKEGLGKRIEAKLIEVAEALRAAGAGGRLWRAAALTVPQWVGIFAFYAILSRAMGLPESINLIEASFGASLAVLTNLLPINGLAGFGTQEGGWVLGFGILGVAHDEALKTALAVHLVQLFDVVVFGLVAQAWMSLRWPARVAPSATDPRA